MNAVPKGTRRLRKAHGCGRALNVPAHVPSRCAQFGEVGVDDALVKERFETTEDIFEMNNGCICCTVRGDLIAGLKKLIKSSTKNNKPLD